MGQSVRRKAGTLPVLPSPLRGGVGGGGLTRRLRLIFLQPVGRITNPLYAL